MKKQLRAASKCVELMGKASHTLGRLGSALAAAERARRPTKSSSRCSCWARGATSRRITWAQVHCNLGRVESALDLLEQAHEIKDGKSSFG